MKTLIPIFLFAFVVMSAHAQTGSDLKTKLTGIEPEMEKILETWKAPGFAVAVVEKNKVIYAKGFGFRNVENQSPVNENTLFAIGSCTKAFTASVLGILQKEDKLKFEDSPRKYVPELNFFNDEMNDLITIKDLMCHRTGLPRHDYSWYLFPNDSKDSLVERIQWQEPFAHVREKWYYNNFMFLTQGVIAEKITGNSWEENVREKLFQPLEMKRSNLSISELEKNENIATGYELKNDSIIKKMEYYHIAGMSPAGSINSSVSEMGNWLITWINGGKFKGNQIIPQGFVTEAISSQMVIDGGLPEKEYPDLNFANYGLGWFLSSYKSHFMVQHGGNIDGFSAMTCFFPTDSVGIVILTNQNGSAVPSIVRNTVADCILDLPPTKWNDDIKAKSDKAIKEQKEALEKSASTRQLNTKPSHSLVEYTGSYNNPGYGTFEIKAVNDSLIAQLKLQKIWLKHYHYDIFTPYFIEYEEIDTTEPPQIFFNFLTNDAGEISGLKAKIEPATDPVEFKRTPNLIEVDDKLLQKYIGEYELAGMVAKIYKKDKTFCLFVPGQPEYILLATGLHKFSIKNLDGFKIEFVENDKKEITGVLFIQPNGTFKAEKKSLSE